MRGKRESSIEISLEDCAASIQQAGRVCPTKNVGTAMTPWYMYMIECRDGSIYTGVTIDVAARYQQHVAGKGARYTRSHPPQRLLAVVEHVDRSAALKAEHAIKGMSAAEKRCYAARQNLLW